MELRSKKPVLILTLLLLSLRAVAQIPYYAGTVGNGKLYGYTSVKARPGINHQETYTTFQYGIGNHFATGVDLYTGLHCAYFHIISDMGMVCCKMSRDDFQSYIRIQRCRNFSVFF